MQRDLEVYHVVFDLFDQDGTGFVEDEDIIAMAVSLKKDVTKVMEAFQKVVQLRQDHQEGMSFGEFVTMMWDVSDNQMKGSEGQSTILGPQIGSQQPSRKYILQKKARRESINRMKVNINTTSDINSPVRIQRKYSMESPVNFSPAGKLGNNKDILMMTDQREKSPGLEMDLIYEELSLDHKPQKELQVAKLLTQDAPTKKGQKLALTLTQMKKETLSSKSDISRDSRVSGKKQEPHIKDLSRTQTISPATRKHMRLKKHLTVVTDKSRFDSPTSKEPQAQNRSQFMKSLISKASNSPEAKKS